MSLPAWCLVAALTLAGAGCRAESPPASGGVAEPPPFRSPAVAGTFYPADPVALRAAVDGLLSQAPAVAVTGTVGAIVAPHAGYVFSGPTAARAFSALRGRRYDTVVVVAPSHHTAYPGYSVWWRGAYRTPLGDVPVDEEFCRELFSAAPGGTFTLASHQREHALEVELPFLLRALPPFRLVPVIMADQGREASASLARGLASVCRGRRVLLVASSDLSHFHPLAEARRLDDAFVAALGTGDPGRLRDCVDGGRAEACGEGPVAAVLGAARLLGYDTVQVTGYDTSATASGDATRVVGYVSAVLSGSGKADGMATKGASTEIFSLSEAEKRTLLTLARATIEARTAGRPLPEATATTEKLGRRSGAFVTLKMDGDLRGCIGFIVAQKPLVETIQEMALSAAFRDPRFRPVTAAEVPRLEIEISVLSPFERVTDPTVIEAGRHGIQLTRGWNSGLLLPQVATEYGWDRETFLEHTCDKAGLPRGAWKDPATEIRVFTAEIFNEETLKMGPWGR